WSGDWMVVGASAADSNAGRAYAVQRDAAGRWQAPMRLNIPRTQAPGGARLGSAVALVGDTAYVGATGAAMVTVVSRSGGARWSFAGELRPFDAPRGSQFGFAIARVGNELWVGAPGV